MKCRKKGERQKGTVILLKTKTEKKAVNQLQPSGSQGGDDWVIFSSKK